MKKRRENLDETLRIDARLFDLVASAAQGDGAAAAEAIDLLVQQNAATQQAWLTEIKRQTRITPAELTRMLADAVRRSRRPAGTLIDIGDDLALVVRNPVVLGPLGRLPDGTLVAAIAAHGHHRNRTGMIIFALTAEQLIPVAFRAALQWGESSVDADADDGDEPALLKFLASDPRYDEVTDWRPAWLCEGLLVDLHHGRRPRARGVADEMAAMIHAAGLGRDFGQMVAVLQLATLVHMDQRTSVQLQLCGLEAPVVYGIAELFELPPSGLYPVRGRWNIEVPPALRAEQVFAIAESSGQFCALKNRMLAAYVTEAEDITRQIGQPEPLVGHARAVARYLGVDEQIIVSSAEASRSIPLSLPAAEMILAAGDAVVEARSRTIKTGPILIALARRRGHEVHPEVFDQAKWWRRYSLPEPRLLGSLLTMFVVDRRRVSGTYRYSFDLRRLAEVIRALGDPDRADQILELLAEAAPRHAAKST